MEQALVDGSHLLIEATSNQVNHQGGYTGMQPEDFRRLVEGIAQEKKFDAAKLILGGDHLGPNPWQSQPAADAMREAEQMVEGYARAGFTKIHLDASMACGSERGPLDDETIARRAAQLLALLDGGTEPLETVAGRTLRIQHWRQAAQLSADSILEERQLYAAARSAVSLA